MKVVQNRKREKIALVMAGGGLTGAVYEVGALRAIDDLLVDRSVADFDIFVGTSAGAIVASALASGLHPETMMRVFDGSDPNISPVKRSDIFNFNITEIVRQAMRMPRTMVGGWTRFLMHPNEMTFFDVLWSLAQAMPTGLYDGMALERYMRQFLSSVGAANDFAALDRELYVIATDLDSGERVVFGPRHRMDVPISMAVAASTALPVVYKPVRIGDRDMVDGGLRGNASIDLAVERGATLVVCINPLVPFDRSQSAASPGPGDASDSCDQRGLQSVVSQITRIITHAGLEYHVKQLRRAHPEVDIILIEPHASDCQMFNGNIMTYSARLDIARHGFESVTLHLAEGYRDYKAILARHDIPITRRLVIEELREIRESNYDPDVISRVLARRAPACGLNSRNSVACDLDRTLAELDLALAQMSRDQAA